MSTSLYRSYRPQSFLDVVGQEHIVSTLQRALEQEKVSHAYLFCGPRGTGKTSMARLLAKALLQETGPRSDFDPESEASQAVAKGVHPDVFELDAASRTGVDSVREEIINKVNLAPSQGAYKIYIIDEVHMLTTAAFNALLKTLEEPPSHVVFILCTTDPQKVPETIVSRCQRFEFSPFSLEDLSSRLAYVCDQEKIRYDKAALELVALHAAGGMRDALSSLEQLAVFGDGAIHLDDAQALLGETKSGELKELAQALAQRDMPSCYSYLEELAKKGTDFTKFISDFCSYLRDVYICSLGGLPNHGQEDKAAYQAELQELVALFRGQDRIARVLSLLAELISQLRYAQDQRLCIEIMFTRIAHPDADLSLFSLAQRIESLELELAQLRSTSLVQDSHKAAVKVHNPAPIAALQSDRTDTATDTVSNTVPDTISDTIPDTNKVAIQAAAVEEPSLQEADKTEAPAQVKAQSKLASSSQDYLVKWEEIKQELIREQPARGLLLQHASLVLEDESYIIEFPPDSEFSLNMFEKPDNRALIKEKLEHALATSCRLSMRIVGAKAAASQPAKREPKPVEQQVEAQTPPKVQVKQKSAELQESVQAPEPKQKPVQAPEPAPVPEQKPDPDPDSVRQSSAKAHDPRVPEALAQKLNEGFEAEWRFKGNV